MKKMMMAACAAIMLVSCGKEEVATVTGIDNESGNVKTMPYRKFTGQRCINYIGACLPDVVVNGNDQKKVDGVFDVIDKGNQSDIKTAFSANQSVLKKYINTQEIDDVIAGNLEVTATDGDSGGSLHYMVFNATRQSGNIKAVYPFKD